MTPATLIACIDADYRDTEGVTACVAIRNFTDELPILERVVRSPHTPEPYVPGAFYLRELPGILAVLEQIRASDEGTLACVIVDSYVWLGTDRPGLGARLYDALHIPVIGVAKTSFHANDRAVPVTRGTSTRPLFVTSEGIDVHEAAAHITSMHGAHRHPTILKRVDRLARES